MSCKQTWTTEEDIYLKNLIPESGKINWNEIAQSLNTQFPSKSRTAKQCRGRFSNYSKFLSFDSELSKWKAQDVDILLEEFKKYGSSWRRVAQSLPGKSQNSIKNKFYGTLRKVVRKLNDAGISQSKKNRRHIKQQSVVRIIEAAETFRSLQSPLREESIQLRERIFQMIKGIENQSDVNDIKKLLTRINQFNLKTRSFRPKKGKDHVEFKDVHVQKSLKPQLRDPLQVVSVEQETENEILKNQLGIKTFYSPNQGQIGTIDQEIGQYIASQVPVELKQKQQNPRLSLTSEDSSELLPSLTFLDQDDLNYNFEDIFSKEQPRQFGQDLFY